MSLNLPDSPRKLVFRALVGLLQADPDLKRTIKPASWFAWSGNPQDAAPPVVQGRCPVAKLTPIALPATAETQAAQNSPFGVGLFVATWGTNLDDLLDLWGAFERAVFTGDGAKSTTIALRSALANNAGAAGASVQSLRLGVPAIQPVMEDAEFKYMTATGTIFIQM